VAARSTRSKSAKFIGSAFWQMTRPSRRSQRAKPSWMACARADFIEEHYHRAPLCRGRLANEATVVAKRANIKIPVVMVNVRDLKANRNS
jgi:hypothetical protein